MKNLQWLFLILLQCSFLFAHTQSKHISFDHIGNAEGLPQSNIFIIGEDKKQYMLEGFDEKWIEAGTNRVATYTNLNPGRYIFKVRGLNNEGKISSAVTSIELIIKPPFWLTWWFKLAVLIVAAGAVTALYHSKMQAIKNQRRVLQQQVKEKTQQLALAAKQEEKARKEAEAANFAVKLANKELKESERRYSSLFHENPQPMFVYNIETLKFTQVNRAAIKQYGYTEAEFLSLTIKNIQPQEEDEWELVPSEKGVGKIVKVASDGKIRHRTKFGDLINVEVYSNPIVVSNKEYRLIIAIDMTEKMLLENKITRAIIKTQEDERYEIGAELHDNVCQILASSQISIGRLKNSLPPSMVPLCEQSKSYINMALEEIRNLSHRLAPVFFDGMTLEETFKQLAASFNADNSYQVCFYFYKSFKESLISKDIQRTLYRILQEQLTNIVKYSRASYISIDVMINEQKELVMQTSDDGIGFDVLTTKKGIGLANMKRRAELFSGSIQVDSSPGNGCSITVTIPLA